MTDNGGRDRDRMMQQYEQRVQSLIAQFGYMVQQVMPDGESGEPGFVYTVGLSEKGLADLIFIGSYVDAAANYVRTFARYQLDGGELPRGLILPGDVNEYAVPVYLVDADHRLQTHAHQVTNRHEGLNINQPLRMVQVVMPDPAGRFPWEDGYDWLDQRVDKPAGLGERPN